MKCGCVWRDGVDDPNGPPFRECKNHECMRLALWKAEAECERLRALLRETLPFVERAQEWDGHVSDTPDKLIARIDAALAEKP